MADQPTRVIGCGVMRDAHLDPDATAIAAAVRTGRTTARSVVEEALERIALHRTNAVVTVGAAAARATAARIDEAVARGDDPGPLAGVPITIKDTLATAGLRATAGSLVLADHIPNHDAEVVARLRAAGAVLVGKTNCPEFALQPRTDNRIFGPTAHPFDPSRSPGGSSGGCAAAVAGGLVPFSIGGDYGGSVRYPAACTGIYGLRPTYRAVPTAGHVPEPAEGTPRRRFQTVGPLARTPRDIRLLFDVIAAVGARPSARTTAGDAPSPRIGVVRGGWSCITAVADSVDRAARSFADVGYDVVDVDPAPFVEAADVYAAWRASDEYTDLRALVAGREADLTTHIARLLATRPVPADVTARFEAVGRAVAAVLASTPVLVLPVARVGVLGLEATEIEIDGRVESVDALQVLAPSRAVTVLGLPSLAVPAGLDRDGLPIGVQVVGAANTEHQLVAVAETLRSAPALGDAPVRAGERDL
ncbi:MAG TPA: amidase [Acidimicrobiia bacterium]|nr:amidase [Acidimicrobiia bacterium]